MIKTKAEAIDYLLHLQQQRKLRKSALIYQIESLPEKFVNDLLAKVDITQVAEVDKGSFAQRRMFEEIIAGASCDINKASLPTEATANIGWAGAKNGVPDALGGLKEEKFEAFQKAAVAEEAAAPVDKGGRVYAKGELLDILTKALEEGVLKGSPQHGGDVDLIPCVEVARTPEELQRLTKIMRAKGLLPR